MNYGTCADPEAAVRIARHAEAAGFESLWMGEHFALPDPKPDWFTMEPTLPFLDTIVALTLVAATTKTIGIASGILELPLHHPVKLAKQLASVDRVSAGRLHVGVGVGYLEAEFAAFGVALAERRSRADEYIDAMRALWTMPSPEFHGQHVDFSGIDAQPRPVQAGGPPIVVGGLGDSARRRAVERGNGWFVYDTDVAWIADAMKLVERDTDLYERPAELGRLEFTTIPAGDFDRRVADQYEELGVDRVVLPPELNTPIERRHESVDLDAILRMIDRAATELIDR